MTAASSPMLMPVGEPAISAVPRRTATFWLTTVAIVFAFFLAVHDLDASQHWAGTEKGEVNSLAEEEASGRASRQIGFLMLGAIGVILLARPGVIAMEPRPLVLFIVCALLMWAMASALWSADASVSLKREIVLLCMLLAAGGLIKQFSMTDLAGMTLVHTLAVVAIGAIIEFGFEPTPVLGGEEYRFAGTLHPNHMGINASLLLLASLYFAHARANARFYLISAIAVLTLLATKSRTALSSACVGSLVFALLAYPARKRIALMLLILLTSAIAMVTVATDAFSNLGQTVLMNRANSDPTTLTGRTMIWQFAFDRVRGDWSRLLAGFGYGGFWTAETSAALSQRAHFALAEGHNAYLDVMLQLGFIGLALYFCFMLGTLKIWISIARRFSSAGAAFAAAVICFALNHHLAESALIAPTFPTLVLWCILGMAVLQRNRLVDPRGTH